MSHDWQDMNQTGQAERQTVWAVRKALRAASQIERAVSAKIAPEQRQRSSLQPPTAETAPVNHSCTCNNPSTAGLENKKTGAHHIRITLITLITHIIILITQITHIIILITLITNQCNALII